MHGQNYDQNSVKNLYLPQLELIDTASLLQNRYAFVEGQKNFKNNKKLNQSMLLNNCYLRVIQYVRAPELPLKKRRGTQCGIEFHVFIIKLFRNQTGEGREIILKQNRLN